MSPSLVRGVFPFSLSIICGCPAPLLKLNVCFDSIITMVTKRGPTPLSQTGPTTRLPHIQIPPNTLGIDLHATNSMPTNNATLRGLFLLVKIAFVHGGNFALPMSSLKERKVRFQIFLPVLPILSCYPTATPVYRIGPIAGYNTRIDWSTTNSNERPSPGTPETRDVSNALLLLH